MKKLLLLLFTLPLFCFGQEGLNSIYDYNTTLDTAVVYTPTGILDFNKSVGNCFVAGGTFLFLGALTNVISFSVKPKTPENYTGIDKYDKYVERFNKNQRAFTIVGWSFIGLSAILFASGGILYIKQDQIRKCVVIRGSVNSLSLLYKF